MYPKIMADTQTLALLGGRLRWAADSERPTEDAFWLAACAQVAPGQRVLDAGCGSGAVGLALWVQHPDITLTALDYNPELVQQARVNYALNGAGACFVVGEFAQLPFVAGAFDHVVANPPFHARAAGYATPNTRKAQRNALAVGDLATWVAAWQQVAPQVTVLAHAREAAAFPQAGVTWLRSHPQRPAKRCVLHFGAPNIQNTIPTYAPAQRARVLRA